jgi:hypothetical protein
MNWYRKIAMPVYDVFHGTGNSQSIYDNNFSYEYIGTGNDEYGPGFYFTNDEATANRYVGEGDSPGVIRAKVNLSNPIEIDGVQSGSFFEKFPPMDTNQVRQALEYSLSAFGDDFLYNWGDVDFEGRENIIEKIVGEYAGKSLMSVIYDFFHQDTVEGMKYIREQLGYDGIVVSFNDGIQIIVAWFQEQIEIEGRS